MKQILILLFLAYGSAFGLDLSKNININEWKSDSYFGNGIMTTEQESRDTLRDILIPSIEREIYKGNTDEMNSYHGFALAYNYSPKEDFNNTIVAMSLDLMESSEQLKNTSVGWWLANQIGSWLFSRSHCPQWECTSK